MIMINLLIIITYGDLETPNVDSSVTISLHKTWLLGERPPLAGFNIFCKVFIQIFASNKNHHYDHHLTISIMIIITISIVIVITISLMIIITIIIMAAKR